MIFLLPLFLLIVLLAYAGLSVLALSFFTMFYVWSLVFKLPEVRERAMTFKYRYSFLRQMFRLDELMMKRTPHIHPIVRRQMPPLFFMLIAFALTLDPFVFSGLLGGLLLEGLYALSRGHDGLFQNFKKHIK